MRRFQAFNKWQSRFCFSYIILYGSKSPPYIIKHISHSPSSPH